MCTSSACTYPEDVLIKVSGEKQGVGLGVGAGVLVGAFVFTIGDGVGTGMGASVLVGADVGASVAFGCPPLALALPRVTLMK